MKFVDFEEQIKVFIGNLFASSTKTNLYYHNLDHTMTVCRNAIDIAANYTLPKQARHILFAATWFHDIGYLSASSAVHEDESIRVMKEFFSRYDVDADIVRQVAECIHSTKFSVTPSNILEA